MAEAAELPFTIHPEEALRLKPVKDRYEVVFSSAISAPVDVEKHHHAFIACKTCTRDNDWPGLGIGY